MITFNLLLAETGNLGIEVYSLGESKIHIEVDSKPVSLQELKLGFIGQYAQDFLIALRSLLTLIGEGTA